MARSSPGGRSTTSRARRSTRTGYTPRRPAAGSGRSSSAPTMRENLAPARHARRRADHHARRHAQGGEQQVRLRHEFADRQAADDASALRRHAAAVGVQARLASGAVADRSRTPSMPASRTRRSSDRPTAAQTWHELAGLRGAAGREVGARRRRHGAAHDHPRSEQSQPHLHRHLRRPGRSAPTTAARPGRSITKGLKSQVHARPECRGRLLRSPHRACTRRGRTRSSCNCTGT